MGQMGLGWFTSGPLLVLLVLALIVNAQKKKRTKNYKRGLLRIWKEGCFSGTVQKMYGTTRYKVRSQ